MTPQQTIVTGDPTAAPTLLDRLQQNSKLLIIGAAVIAVAAAGFWFYLRSAEIKRANAERQLNQAKQSIAAGNPALAQNDLQRVASRYKGTPAGAQAALLLAQLEYNQGKFAEGVQALSGYTNDGAAGPLLGSIWALTGDGHMAQGKPAEAADAYQKAADATALIGEKGMYLAKAARALQAANRNADAQAIWERLVSDPQMPARSEAQVRLGELLARPAGSN